MEEGNMYCSSCGLELSNSYRFCPQCGTPASGVTEFVSATGKPARALRRPRDEKKIAGVCAGLARYLGIDVTLVRIVVLCLALWPPGVGIIFYIICWIAMPLDPYLLPPPPANAELAPKEAGI
jgi:phage shock protein C